MPIRKLSAFALATTLSLAAFAAPARAQELALRLTHRGEHGSVSLTLGRDGRAEHHRVRCAPARVWVPGHFETRCEQVWVPGCTRREWVPPRYEWRRDACGRAYQVLVCAGHWALVAEPGRYETRETRVWVPATWRVPGY